MLGENVLGQQLYILREQAEDKLVQEVGDALAVVALSDQFLGDASERVAAATLPSRVSSGRSRSGSVSGAHRSFLPNLERVEVGQPEPISQRSYW